MKDQTGTWVLFLLRVVPEAVGTVNLPVLNADQDVS